MSTSRSPSRIVLSTKPPAPSCPLSFLANALSSASSTTMRLPLKPSSLLTTRRAIPPGLVPHRAFASRASRPPPFPTVETCPSPSCTCAPMPSFPDGLKIDHKAPINGVMAAYAEQVLVCTGKDDWTSKIEDDKEGHNFAAEMKQLFGRGGKYTDVGSLRSVRTVVGTVTD